MLPGVEAWTGKLTFNLRWLRETSTGSEIRASTRIQYSRSETFMSDRWPEKSSTGTAEAAVEACRKCLREVFTLEPNIRPPAPGCTAIARLQSEHVRHRCRRQDRDKV